MIPNYSKVHNKFKINNVDSDFDHLKDVAYSLVKEGEPYEREIGNFLLDWLDDKDHIITATSGSTGRAKKIKISKQSMVNSAIATADYFKLSPGNKAILCLPAQYIAGKMMLVRAIMIGLELETIQPSTSLNIGKNRYRFCAMLPMQLEQNLSKLNQFHTIIVGGAQVLPHLKEAIQKSRARIFETYGMTETLSHIAVKKLNNFLTSEDPKNSHFNCLPGVVISQDDHGCLVIEASHLFDGKIRTNDVVQLHSESEFEWLGRVDNVINSGGKKLNPEKIEQKIGSYISRSFFIGSEKDDTLGEKLIMVVEGEENGFELSDISGLTKFEKPKQVYHIPKFIRTHSGKVQRNETLKLLKLKR